LDAVRAIGWEAANVLWAVLGPRIDGRSCVSALSRLLILELNTSFWRVRSYKETPFRPPPPVTPTTDRLTIVLDRSVPMMDDLQGFLFGSSGGAGDFGGLLSPNHGGGGLPDTDAVMFVNADFDYREPAGEAWGSYAGGSEAGSAGDGFALHPGALMDPTLRLSGPMDAWRKGAKGSPSAVKLGMGNGCQTPPLTPQDMPVNASQYGPTRGSKRTLIEERPEDAHYDGSKRARGGQQSRQQQQHVVPLSAPLPMSAMPMQATQMNSPTASMSMPCPQPPAAYASQPTYASYAPVYSSPVMFSTMYGGSPMMLRRPNGPGMNAAEAFSLESRLLHDAMILSHSRRTLAPKSTNSLGGTGKRDVLEVKISLESTTAFSAKGSKSSGPRKLSFEPVSAAGNEDPPSSADEESDRQTNDKARIDNIASGREGEPKSDEKEEDDRSLESLSPLSMLTCAPSPSAEAELLHMDDLFHASYVDLSEPNIETS
jgi:hypothetical protein